MYAIKLTQGDKIIIKRIEGDVEILLKKIRVEARKAIVEVERVDNPLHDIVKFLPGDFPDLDNDPDAIKKDREAKALEKIKNKGWYYNKW